MGEAGSSEMLPWASSSSFGGEIDAQFGEVPEEGLVVACRADGE